METEPTSSSGATQGAGVHMSRKEWANIKKRRKQKEKRRAIGAKHGDEVRRLAEEDPTAPPPLSKRALKRKAKYGPGREPGATTYLYQNRGAGKHANDVERVYVRQQKLIEEGALRVCEGCGIDRIIIPRGYKCAQNNHGPICAGCTSLGYCPMCRGPLDMDTELRTTPQDLKLTCISYEHLSRSKSSCRVVMTPDDYNDHFKSCNDKKAAAAGAKPNSQLPQPFGLFGYVPGDEVDAWIFEAAFDDLNITARGPNYFPG